MTIANENIHISDYNLGKNYSKRDLTMRGFCCRGDLDGHTHEVFEEVKENVVYRVVPASKNSPRGLIFRPSVRLSVTLSVIMTLSCFSQHSYPHPPRQQKKNLNPSLRPNIKCWCRSLNTLKGPEKR